MTNEHEDEIGYADLEELDFETYLERLRDAVEAAHEEREFLKSLRDTK